MRMSDQLVPYISMISDSDKRDYKIVRTRSVNNLRSHGIEFAHRAVLLDTKYLGRSKISIFVEWNAGTAADLFQIYIQNLKKKKKNATFPSSINVRIANASQFSVQLGSNYHFFFCFLFSFLLARLAKKR